MNKLIAIGVAALFFAAAIPSVEASRTDYVNYLPGVLVITISCSGDDHNWLPIGDPNPDNPLGWLFSGEPECAPNDLINDATGENNPGGFGGGAFLVYPEEALKTVVASTNDALFGVGNSFLTLRAPESESTGESDTSEGCGPQVVTIPVDPVAHWQSTPDNPYYLTWAFIPEAGVTDDLEVCFSSTGVVEAVIG